MNKGLMAAILALAAARAVHAAGAAAPAKAVKLDFAKEAAGGEPSSLSCVVGFWQAAKDGDNGVLKVDGSRWSSGQASASLADKARALYGQRYAEFLDGVKAYAYFPICVANGIEDFRGGELSVRFKPLAGRIDQAAGIIFNVKPNGDYLVVRANALENNLVLFKYVHGKRGSVKWIRNVPTGTGKWHDLKVSVRGKHIQGYLDGKLLLEEDWIEPISGRTGVWSKADSVAYFDDYEVVANGK